jgi:hypothetical protein
VFGQNPGAIDFDCLPPQDGMANSKLRSLQLGRIPCSSNEADWFEGAFFRRKGRCRAAEGWQGPAIPDRHACAGRRVETDPENPVPSVAEAFERVACDPRRHHVPGLQ